MISPEKTIRFLHIAERLKCELRQGRISEGRRESVADHSWRMSLMVLLTYPYLDKPIDVKKALIMAIIHDLPEIITGDVPYSITVNKKLKKEKDANEEKAMLLLMNELDFPVANELTNYWEEYRNLDSYEALFVHSLDKLEAQIQQNQSDFSYWTAFEKKTASNYLDAFCDFDNYIQALKNSIQSKSEEILITNSAVSCT